MAYISGNPKTKKQLKEWVKQGKEVTAFQPNAMFPGSEPPKNGTAYIEGPHYPKPHTWYAEVEIQDGRVVKVK